MIFRIKVASEFDHSRCRFAVEAVLRPSDGQDHRGRATLGDVAAPAGDRRRLVSTRYLSLDHRAIVRRTKILATVGPATSSLSALRRLLHAGADGFRLNLSHGTVHEHRVMLRRMRAAGSRDRELAIVADVQGPKMRIGPIGGGSVRITEGSRWCLDQGSAPGDLRRVGVFLPSFPAGTRRGDQILLGDGNVELAVERSDARTITTRVVHGGEVRSHTGIFLPRARLPASILLPKDRGDIRLAVAEGADYLALSFVRDARDIKNARRALDQAGGESVGIIAKIERAEAVDNADKILAEADGIMIARGDLGIEVPLERLALEQKRLLERAHGAGKLSIVATQMLLSMVHSPRPTRAEATDVANAVLGSADAVMLSEETATGDFPVEAVAWLDRIAMATEASVDVEQIRRIPPSADTKSTERAVASAAVELAEGVPASAIVTPTHSGRTACRVAALRPRVPVVAIASDPRVLRRLALVWGVTGRQFRHHKSLVELRTTAWRTAHSVTGSQGPIVLTAGFPVRGRPTNLVTLVEEP